MPRKNESIVGRKPLDNFIVQAIQRFHFFSVALMEYLCLKEANSMGVSIPPRVKMTAENDKVVFQYLVEFIQVYKNQALDVNDSSSLILLCLILAELRVSPIGYVVEGEAEMPYRIAKGRFVYRAKMPFPCYPVTCLHCGKVLSSTNKTYCKNSCRLSWERMVSQFKNIRKSVLSEQSLFAKFGTLFNAYALFLANPHYGNYQARNPMVLEMAKNGEVNGTVSFYKDKIGNTVDLMGNQLKDAYLITDIEELLN